MESFLVGSGTQTGSASVRGGERKLRQDTAQTSLLSVPPPTGCLSQAPLLVPHPNSNEDVFHAEGAQSLDLFSFQPISLGELIQPNGFKYH